MAAAVAPAPAAVLESRRSYPQGRASQTTVGDGRRGSGVAATSRRGSAESVGSFAQRRRSTRMNTPEYFPDQSVIDDAADWDFRAGEVPRGRNSLAAFAFHPQASLLHPMAEGGGPWGALAGTLPHAGPLEPEGQDVTAGRRASYARRSSLQSLDDDDILAQASYRPRLRTDSNFGFPTAPNMGLPPASLPAGAAAWSGSLPHPGLPGMPPAIGSPYYPGLVPGLPPPAPPTVWPGSYPYSLPPHLAAHQQPAFLQPPTPYVNLQQHAVPPQQSVMWAPQGRHGRSDQSYGGHYSVNHSAGAAAAAAHAAVELPAGPKTTLMLQNLPDRFTRDMLINLLNREGFAGQYDFAYLPVAFDTMQGLNHAFINMCNPDSAEVFQEHFNNFKGWPVPSDKVCVAAWHDRQQGLAPLIERYRNSPVMHESVPDECKPLIFQGGRPVEFPPPTQKIKPPKALKQTG